MLNELFFDEDGDLDLAYGGWWSPVSILENQDGRLSSEPCWVSEKSDIVVEALDWADVDGQPGAELMVTDHSEEAPHLVITRPQAPATSHGVQPRACVRYSGRRSLHAPGVRQPQP